MRIVWSVGECYPYDFFCEANGFNVGKEFDVPTDLWDEYRAAQDALARAEAKLIDVATATHEVTA